MCLHWVPSAKCKCPKVSSWGFSWKKTNSYWGSRWIKALYVQALWNLFSELFSLSFNLETNWKAWDGEKFKFVLMWGRKLDMKLMQRASTESLTSSSMETTLKANLVHIGSEPYWEKHPTLELCISTHFHLYFIIQVTHSSLPSVLTLESH